MAAFCTAVLAQHLDRRENLGYHIWGLLTLMLWMKRWKVEPPSGDTADRGIARRNAGSPGLIVVLFAAADLSRRVLSPPSLMDDVDAVQAQIAANMLRVGRLGDGPAERRRVSGKIAACVLADGGVVMPSSAYMTGPRGSRSRSERSAFAGLRTRIGRWAFGEREGLYSGLALATSLGLWLFTRILIPDVILTGTIALALWALLRALDEAEAHPHVWSARVRGRDRNRTALKGSDCGCVPGRRCGDLSRCHRQLLRERRLGSGFAR